MAQLAFDKIAPGKPNPFLSAVANLKNKINECWKVLKEIILKNEPMPIMPQDYQIELMGSKNSNP